MTTRPLWHRNRSGTAMRRCAGLRVESLEQRTMLAANILVSEVNYFPAEPTAAETDALGDIGASEFDFLEIYNADGVIVDLQDYEFTQGVSFVFPQVSINPGQFAVIVKNQSAFRLRYGDAPFVIGEFTSGSLNDSGERVKLVDRLNAELVDFDYDDTRPWPESADGHGATLELIDPDNTPADELDEYFRWRGSTEFGGSPGVRGAGPLGIIVNEVLTHTDAPITLPDSIELFNTTDEPIDVSGWFLSDSFNSPLRFEIPSGTVIQPKDYVVFDETHFNPTPEAPGPNDFALSGAHGDEAILSISDGQGGIGAFVDSVNFGGTANGESFGRLPNGTGTLGPLSHNSFGCDNTAARVGPVIITEMNYHPADPTQMDLSSSDVEYIEIHNPTSEPVDLTNWRIRGGVAFDFVAGEMLAPRETVLVLKLDPSNPTLLEAFRANYGLASGQRFMGPWSGKLGNAGDRVELQYADEPPLEEPDFFPHLIEDIVVYDDRAPWPETPPTAHPVGPDGGGQTLQRVAPYLYGSDPVSWVGAEPTPGTVTFQQGVTGDFNGDGLITGTDVELLRDFVRSEVQIQEYDLNGDVVVNSDDVNHLVFSIAESRSGDANFDRLVDGRDFTIWQASRDRPCGNLSSGDFNGDQFIDDGDFALWNINRFTGTVGPQVPSNRIPRAPLGNRVSVQQMADSSRAAQHSDARADSAIEPLANAMTKRSVLSFAAPQAVAEKDSRLSSSSRKFALVDKSVDQFFAAESPDDQVSWLPLFEQDFRTRHWR